MKKDFKFNDGGMDFIFFFGGGGGGGGLGVFGGGVGGRFSAYLAIVFFS